MTGLSVSDGDMPTIPWPAPPDARALDALLSGACHAEDAPAELRPVAEVLVALQAPTDPQEIAGWDEALLAYREIAARRERRGRVRSRSAGSGASRFGARLAAAAGAAVVALLGGGVAAAYTGSLPVSLQKLAHDAIAAPAARGSQTAPDPRHAGQPTGPAASGSAAYGLCNAYQQAEEHGNGVQRAVAFRNLISAAGGAGQVAAYCAAVQHPGAASPPGRQVGQAGASPDGEPTAPPGKETGGGNAGGNAGNDNANPKGGGNGNGTGAANAGGSAGSASGSAGNASGSAGNASGSAKGGGDGGAKGGGNAVGQRS